MVQKNPWALRIAGDESDYGDEMGDYGDESEEIYVDVFMKTNKFK